MKAFFGNALLILCFTPAICLDALAGSERSGQGGVIHFRGQIVEGGCAVDPSTRNVNVSCYRDGNHHQNTIPVTSLSHGETQHLRDATLNMQWLNKQKTLAVISVQYQ
ncbi:MULTISPECIES: hypothetical protein [unclassified Pseudocitrobacter]|uniref:hypothetical protein n=1 Tax=unclassified Pseudocitrobacter TaxID=2638778 RepID=UPI0023E40FC3|nr:MULTISPECIES: hypothetical protein [unclassified Pseudocitrobacter]MDF3827919.1 hypothetical protein [Pseudocitrobacter sp. 2023EL-00150]MEC5373535.1 hypothetical protein [Pseudocitrobacter sp. MW920760]